LQNIQYQQKTKLKKEDLLTIHNEHNNTHCLIYNSNDIK